MNSGTTTSPGTNFPQQLVQQIQEAMAEGTRNGCRIMWIAIKQALIEHWLIFIVCLVILLALAIVKYQLTGRWGMLASVLYNYLYFGTLFIIAMIFGPEVFASDYIKIILALVYMACFALVGGFLKMTGLRKQYGRTRP